MNQAIIYNQDNGCVAIVLPTEYALSLHGIDAIAANDVPDGVAYEIVDAAHIPNERTFRNAWFHDTTSAPQKIGIDVAKAKIISHEKRRLKRSEEFAPLDVQATIPAQAAAAESARQAIREKYTAMQAEIDACTDSGELISIIKREGL